MSKKVLVKAVVLQAQVKQCEEILNGEEGEVFLHAIGNAINRSINLALSVVANFNGAVAYEANTSTIELVGECFCHIVKLRGEHNCNALERHHHQSVGNMITDDNNYACVALPIILALQPSIEIPKKHH